MDGGSQNSLFLGLRIAGLGHPDPWPSTPHAHDYEANVKLDIKDGTVYHATTKKAVHRVKKADLIELRSEIEERWPNIPLEPLEA